MKIEFSSQRREMLLFLTTNMAAVTSRANQQLRMYKTIQKASHLVSFGFSLNPYFVNYKMPCEHCNAVITIEF